MSGSSKTILERARRAGRFRYRLGRDWLRLNVAGRLKHRLWRRWVDFEVDPADVRLHIGSGKERLPGWVNVDLQTYLEADVALDVTRGFPFTDVRRIFAEHFLEHLPVDDALRFLGASHRALAADGWLRLSTPNLDWVWRNVYRWNDGPASGDGEHRVLSGIHANRAFYGWQHRFLWNLELLEKALTVTGFEDLRWCRYGESELPEFQGIERHETYDDDEDVPHVLIVEARPGEARQRELDRFLEQLRQEFLQSLEA